MKAGKVWGSTQCIHQNGLIELHSIEFEAGAKCSEHVHRFKSNGFYVEKGVMLIRVWQEDQKLLDETILKAGDYTVVPPGKYHQFEGIEDGIAFEYYYPELNHTDIVRRTSGSKI